MRKYQKIKQSLVNKFMLSTIGFGIDRLQDKTTALDPKSRRHNKDHIPQSRSFVAQTRDSHAHGNLSIYVLLLERL